MPWRAGDLMPAVRLLKSHISAGEDKANTANAQTGNILDKISEFWAFFGPLSYTISGKCVHVAGVIDAELVRFSSFNTAPQAKSEGTISEALCDVHDGLPVETPSNALVQSAGGLSNHSLVPFVV